MSMSATPIRICVIAPAYFYATHPQILDALKPVTPPDVSLEVRYIQDGSPCIENRADWQENGMAVVRLAREAASARFHGIWVADFDMCGVEAAREVVDIPVVGGFPAPAITAMSLGGRFSIITLAQSMLTMQRNHVLGYGLRDAFASIRSINCSTNDLNNPELVVNKALEQAMRAVKEDGAETIVLGHAGLIQVARRITELLEDILGIHVPVIDANQASFGFLLSQVRMGARPSRLSYTKVTLPA